MSRGLTLPLLVLVFLAAALFFLVQAEGGVAVIPHLFTRVGLPAPAWPNAGE